VNGAVSHSIVATVREFIEEFGCSAGVTAVGCCYLSAVPIGEPQRVGRWTTAPSASITICRRPPPAYQVVATRTPTRNQPGPTG
jgi:hypothetical protein